MLYTSTLLNTPGKTQNSPTSSQVSRKLMTSNMMAARSWETTLISWNGQTPGSRPVESISLRAMLSMEKTTPWRNSKSNRSSIPKSVIADFVSKS